METITTFDDLLESIGGMGTFQFVMTFLMAIMLAMQMEQIYPVFFAAEMPHWCSIPEMTSYPFELQQKVGIPYDMREGNGYSACSYYRLNYSAFSPRQILNWNRSDFINESTPTAECESWVYDRSQFAATIISQFDTVCGDTWMVSFSTSLLFLGACVGSFTGAFISDNVGRRVALLVGLTVKTVGNFMGAYVSSFAIYCVANFLGGFGGLALFNTGQIYMMEMLPYKWTTKASAMTYTFVSVGFMSTAFFAYVARDYSTLYHFLAVPSIVYYILFFYMPESPRWLLSKDKFNEANDVMTFIAEVNGHPSEIHTEKLKVISPEDENTTKTSVLDLFRNKTICKRTIILFFYWFTSSLQYFSLSLGAGNLSGDIFLNTALLAAVEVPSWVLYYFLMDCKYVGRRGVNCGAVLVARTALLISVPLIILGGYQGYVKIMTLIAKAAAALSVSACGLFTMELFPTDVRNIGYGCCCLWLTLGAMAAPYMVAEMVNIWEPLPNLINGVMGILAGLLVLLLPETLGLPLPSSLDDLLNLDKKHRSSKQPTFKERCDGKANEYTDI